MEESYPLDLSGERFTATYRIVGNAEEAMSKAGDICIEQTVEFPGDLLPKGGIADGMPGRIESFAPLADGRSDVIISYPVEAAGRELLQLLNVLYGNISMEPGVRLQRFDLSPTLSKIWRGPRFGRDGLRRLFDVPTRPLLCTALKPMGLSAAELGKMAHQIALGGIDMIKDDHGLADQALSPYKERVQRCCEGVLAANQKTGYHCGYIPNVTAPFDQLMERAVFAKKSGAAALVITPALAGWDAVRCLADSDEIGLPILCHPAYGGSYITSPTNGIAPYAFYGQMTRLMGADAVIFINWGGRFSVNRADCIDIARGTEEPLGTMKSIFPVPGGGMTIGRVDELYKVYGKEVIILVGGGLHRQSRNVTEASRYFRSMVEKIG